MTEREIIDGLERRIAFALGQHYDRVLEWENNARQSLRWLEEAKKRLKATQTISLQVPSIR